jgi:hypothetical protein
MNIEREYIDLMHAEIDGEISVDGQQKLDAYLAGNADARDLRDDLAGLCGQLNTVEQLAPPTNLRHSVMDKIRPRMTPESDEKSALRDIFAGLFGVATIRYAAAFAAGAVLTYTVISSDQISNQYFDDVTSLVGTMTQPEPLSDLTAEDGLRLTLNEVAGTVTLNRSGPILMIEFDLSSQDPVEIVAGFADPDIWFNGFAQLESSGTQISAETGQVTLRMEGQGRYAVYLYNTSPNGASVELQFYSAGILIHEDELIFGEEN